MLVNFVIICLLGKDNQHHNSHSDTVQMNGIQVEEVSKLKEELEEWKNKHELLQGQLREKDSLIEKLVRSNYCLSRSWQGFYFCFKILFALCCEVHHCDGSHAISYDCVLIIKNTVQDGLMGACGFFLTCFLLHTVPRSSLCSSSAVV